MLSAGNHTTNVYQHHEHDEHKEYPCCNNCIKKGRYEFCEWRDQDKPGMICFLYDNKKR